jgi:hypothetical protein
VSIRGGLIVVLLRVARPIPPDSSRIRKTRQVAPRDEWRLEPADNPDAWKIFKVYVGETGLPLNRPKS